MKIKQPNKNLLLLVTAIIVAFNGYSQVKKTTPGTTRKDMTGDYRVRFPVLSKDIQDLQVAIISLDSIGKKNLTWNDDQKQLTKESETEFENEMLSCSRGKDFDVAKTIKRKTYCRRRGYSDAAMGKWYEVNYTSFIKDHKLIIIEFGVMWTNCSHGYSYQKNLLRKCEEEQKQKNIRVDAFIDKLVKEISFYQITATGKK